jgi:hypothetical protein
MAAQSDRIVALWSGTSGGTARCAAHAGHTRTFCGFSCCTAGAARRVLIAYAGRRASQNSVDIFILAAHRVSRVVVHLNQSRTRILESIQRLSRCEIQSSFRPV